MYVELFVVNPHFLIKRTILRYQLRIGENSTNFTVSTGGLKKQTFVVFSELALYIEYNVKFTKKPSTNVYRNLLSEILSRFLSVNRTQTKRR